MPDKARATATNVSASTKSIMTESAHHCNGVRHVVVHPPGKKLSVRLYHLGAKWQQCPNGDEDAAAGTVEALTHARQPQPNAVGSYSESEFGE